MSQGARIPDGMHFAPPGHSALGRAWTLGVNWTKPRLAALWQSDPHVFLLADRAQGAVPGVRGARGSRHGG